MDPNHTYPQTPVQPPVKQNVPESFSVPELPHGPEKLLPSPHRGSLGAAFGIVIILIIVVVGALYFWNYKLASEDAPGRNSGAEVAQ